MVIKEDNIDGKIRERERERERERDLVTQVEKKLDWIIDSGCS